MSFSKHFSPFHSIDAFALEDTLVHAESSVGTTAQQSIAWQEWSSRGWHGLTSLLFAVSRTEVDVVWSGEGKRRNRHNAPQPSTTQHNTLLNLPSKLCIRNAYLFIYLESISSTHLLTQLLINLLVLAFFRVLEVGCQQV